MCSMGIRAADDATQGAPVISGAHECGQPLGADLGIGQREMHAGCALGIAAGAFDADGAWAESMWRIGCCHFCRDAHALECAAVAASWRWHQSGYSYLGLSCASPAWLMAQPCAQLAILVVVLRCKGSKRQCAGSPCIKNGQ